MSAGLVGFFLVPMEGIMSQSFEFQRLHIATGSLSIGVFQASLGADEMVAHVEFLVQLNRWNASGCGCWQYWGEL